MLVVGKAMTARLVAISRGALTPQAAVAPVHQAKKVGEIEEKYDKPRVALVVARTATSTPCHF